MHPNALPISLARAAALWLGLAVAALSAGPAYYFAADGSDASDCASPATPCRSLDRLKSFPQLPGTSFLLRRGDRFPGSVLMRGSGTEAAPILFSAYGQGPAPILDGGVPVPGWVLAEKKAEAWIYAADVPADVDGEPFALIDRDRVLPLARFPDTGYVKVIASDSVSVVLDGPSFAGHLDGIAGATVALRTERRGLVFRTVQAFNPATGRLTLSEPVDRPAASGSGVFINDAPGELDQPGEWHCFPADARLPAGAKRLRLALAPGDAPAAHALRIANTGFGIKGSGISRINIIGIDFENQVSAGIYCYDCSRITVNACGIRNAVLTGLEFRGSGLTATGNAISGSLLAAISAGPDPDLTALERASTGAILEGNRISRIGLLSGFGRSGPDPEEGFGTGIRVTGDGDRVSGNAIDSTASDGIRFLGRADRIEGNLVRSACVHFGDGAALHAGPATGPWSTDASLVANNRVVGVAGSAAGIAGGVSLAYGILLDEKAANVAVEGNVISGADVGLLLRRGRGNVVRGNLLYGNRQAPVREAGAEATTYADNALWAVWAHGAGFLPSLPAEKPCAEGEGCAPKPAGNLACVESEGTAACDGDFAARYPGTTPSALAAVLRTYLSKFSSAPEGALPAGFPGPAPLPRTSPE